MRAGGALVRGEGDRAIADTVFVDTITLTAADWFNDVNRLHYTILADPADRAAVNTALGFYVLAKSAVAVSCPADTTEDTLATITVPANALGISGQIRISTLWSYTNSANVKTCRVRFSGAAGTMFSTTGLTTQLSLSVIVTIGNRGATNSQVGQSIAVSSVGSSQSPTSGIVTAAVDTTAATTIVITGQKASSGETLTLDQYLVEVMKT